MPDYTSTIQIALIGGITIWILVFLETYRHFPNMENEKRVKHSATNATILAVLVIAIIVLAMVFFQTNIMS